MLLFSITTELRFLMISKQRSTKITVYITTYAKPSTELEMNKNYGSRNDPESRFICSICLNTSVKGDEKKYECEKRKSRSCPICQTSDNTTIPCERTNYTNKKEQNDDISTKKIQTSRTNNVDQGLNLLNEVLTVFQSKKELNTKENRLADGKSIKLKDACVSTQVCTPKMPKLSFSKIFHFSIEGGGLQETGNFLIVNSCQPNVSTHSQYSIDLIKHKSSSIPQMKLEELKKSLKEKSKTNKDAIEEVNRMFATVNRNDSFEDFNRPLNRNGPRVLPVVKTIGRRCQKQSRDDMTEQRDKQSCKCCQTNYNMSSGDSLSKQGPCEKNLTQCCHKHQELRSRIVDHDLHICERCRKSACDE